MLVRLFDYNKKAPHTLIGDVRVPLKAGTGKVKAEIASRSVSSMLAERALDSIRELPAAEMAAGTIQRRDSAMSDASSGFGEVGGKPASALLVRFGDAARL